MTCREIMTENPTCCLPSDTAARAAQVMKAEDVGPVPVVDDHGSKRLVGIVTDRDLAINVVAAGRDANGVRLEDVMSTRLFTCSPDADVHGAMKMMSDHQVRRIPIVDEERRLLGIVSQADVARHVHEQAVGDVVEDISTPGGLRSRMFGGGFRRSEWNGESYAATEGSRAGSSLMTAVIGLGIGAGLMYLLDPNSGRRRRTVAKEKAANWSRTAATEVSRRAQDLRGRAGDAVAETRSKFTRSEQADTPADF